MYHNCIFCSAHLGSNEAIEQFPVGRSLAFDAARGRLWTVCPRCARWNLAPLEERWEAIDAGERLFRDTRLRAHSENVGLAKLRDGTRLIRVGEAPGREIAAWRYGQRERVQAGGTLALYLAVGSTFLTGSALGLLGLPLLAGTVAAAHALQNRWDRHVVHVVRDDPEDPTRRIVIRREDVSGSRLSEPDDGRASSSFCPTRG